MLPENDADELRQLQRRAYGRDGAATEGELRRLRELEDARRASPAPSSPAPSVPAPDDDSRPAPPEPAADVASAAAPVVGEGTEPPPDSDVPRRREILARTLRRLPVLVPVVSVLLLAAGVGIGWAVFAPPSPEVTLTAVQQDRRDALAAADFDPGSVVPLAREGDALAWYATREEAGIRCLILDVGAQSQSTCLPVDSIGRGLSATIPVPMEDSGDTPRGVEAVSASMLLSTTGEPIVTLERWPMTSSSPSQFAGAERSRAEELAGEGFVSSLEIVGSFRTLPVWTGDRVSDLGTVEKCLIVDAVDAMTCAASTAAVESGLETRIDRIDGGDGALIGTSTLAARFTRWQTPYLVITEASPGRGGPGEIVRVEAPPGDPIVVEPPGRDPDG
ncbi:hypothetical protein F6W69_15520 [Microbacterium oxydans]|uniref:hypothetical protein n=3 Tax=Microbacterium TaxID=33882 RepID=UPI001143CFA2|nr:hypothetical protein [Microbacterium oxydans]KAB1889464.1 hypothetical protein F6W69_15520 [Microbacterium oxydans]GED39823.1 hypothetical protein MOX01_29650 [Microbacterium oxydans]